MYLRKEGVIFCDAIFHIDGEDIQLEQKARRVWHPDSQ